MLFRTIALSAALLVIPTSLLWQAVSPEPAKPNAPLVCLAPPSDTATALLYGTVSDANTSEGLIGAVVTLLGTKMGGAADIEGNFRVTDIPPGKQVLQVTYIGYLPIKQTILAMAGDSIRLDFALVPNNAALEEVVMVTESKPRSDGKRTKKLESADMAYGASYAPAEGNLSMAFNHDLGGRIPAPVLNPGAIGDTLDHNTEAYDRIFENPFKAVLGNPLSTFSIDVDAASYANVRRFIDYGQRPPADAVRVEEMVNYFTYDYPKPTGKIPFSLITEISDNPWNDSTKLIHIGLQGRDIDRENLAPSNLVFLLDVSGSMNAINKLGLVRSALIKLVDQLGPQDRVAIVVYAGAAGEVLPSTPGNKKQVIRDALNNLQAGGSTAGGAGIKLAYQIAEANLLEKGNNRIILCTDGDFNVGASSDAEMTRLIEEKRETGIYITVCGFGMGNYKDSKMEKIADHGNGNYFYIDREQEAHKVFVTDMRATLFTIAQDVKLQVEFNPAMVSSYRLVGYENRLLAKEDFDDDLKDAGELGAGHTVTALYEVVLREKPALEGWGDAQRDNRQQNPLATEDLRYQQTVVKPGAYSSSEILTLKLRYKEPGGQTSKLLEHPLTQQPIPLALSSDNFRWSAAVAAYSLILRDSQYQGKADLDLVEGLARGAKGPDLEGYRKDFIRLVRATNSAPAAQR